MNIKPVYEKEFHHDGRGPELQRVVWKNNGITLAGFEYYNPEDTYNEESLKHLKFSGMQVYSMAGDEVHGNQVANGETRAAIHEILNSKWLESYISNHLGKCKHYQIMFYDEIYDIICENISFGIGNLNV